MKRTGWINNNINNPESVADHSFRTAILANLFIKNVPTLNSEKVLKMVLMHDLGESIIGDIVTEDGNHTLLQQSVKDNQEIEAVKMLFNNLDEMTSSIIIEYIEQKTQESKFVKELDKLEMIIQALEYEMETGKNLNSFWENVEKYFKTPEIIDTFKKLKTLRKN
ncbi:MAG: HD domain-containing protein [Nanoarchaeota archaeon]